MSEMIILVFCPHQMTGSSELDCITLCALGGGGGGGGTVQCGGRTINTDTSPQLTQKHKNQNKIYF